MLDDVGDLLEAVYVVVRVPLGVRDHEEGGALEQVDLVGGHDLGHPVQSRLHLSHVGNQEVDNGTPGLRKRAFLIIHSISLIDPKLFFYSH